MFRVPHLKCTDVYERNSFFLLWQLLRKQQYGLPEASSNFYCLPSNFQSKIHKFVASAAVRREALAQNPKQDAKSGGSLRSHAKIATERRIPQLHGSHERFEARLLVCTLMFQRPPIWLGCPVES